MKKISKKLKRMLVIVIILMCMVITGLAYFFIYNQAPIIRGNIIYNLKFKENLELDIYQPTKKVFEKSPVVIYLHGGAWVTGRKEVINANRINGAVNKLRNKGYAFVCPDYTLATIEQSPFPACIIDAFDAVNWVADNAAKYNFDIENIGIAGESAGAHIALLVAYAKPQDFSDSIDFSTKIRYVMDIYGPSNLEELYNSQTVEKINARLEKLPESLRKHLDITQHLFGFDPEKDSAKAQLLIDNYSPVNYVSANAPNTLIIHGTDDQIVPVDQSIELDKLLDSLDVKHEFYKLEGVKHAFRGINEEQKENVQNWIAEFIMKNYVQVKN